MAPHFLMSSSLPRTDLVLALLLSSLLPGCLYTKAPCFPGIGKEGLQKLARVEFTTERVNPEDGRILPGPIAQRLRDGEPLIADRFDDVTLLFADIVEFTRLSSTMSASELVAVLNDPEAVARREALLALGRLGDAQAAPVIARDLFSDSAEVRAAAAKALASLKVPTHLDALDALTGDYDRKVRESARAALEVLAPSGTPAQEGKP